ncbi:hypothetical protein ACFWA9_11375 [Kitasatospora sp. NPDC059973]|uniref:hypothetical protein n=1 Tax=Kitasatospora sp. NPDC059973 TaxID=3347020 RepID=UPI0036C9033F
MEAVRVSGVVLAVGRGGVCSRSPGGRYLDGERQESAGRGVDAVRPIRDRVERRAAACSPGSVWGPAREHTGAVSVAGALPVLAGRVLTVHQAGLDGGGASEAAVSRWSGWSGRAGPRA